MAENICNDVHAIIPIVVFLDGSIHCEWPVVLTKDERLEILETLMMVVERE